MLVLIIKIQIGSKSKNYTKLNTLRKLILELKKRKNEKEKRETQ